MGREPLVWMELRGAAFDHVQATFDYVVVWSRPEEPALCVAELKSEPEVHTAEHLNRIRCQWVSHKQILSNAKQWSQWFRLKVNLRLHQQPHTLQGQILFLLGFSYYNNRDTAVFIWQLKMHLNSIMVQKELKNYTRSKITRTMSSLIIWII